VLALHRVLPPRDDAFQPNRGLEITPGFLDALLISLRRADLDIVSMDEAWRRVVSGEPERRFVTLTFDDGYRDTLEHAWPILKKHGVPFTLFVVSAYADGTGSLWWEALEAAVARNTSVEVVLDQRRERLDCATPEAKIEACDRIYTWLRGRREEADVQNAIRQIAADNGVDLASQCRELCLGWGELGALAADPLVTIGAHTLTHPFLSKLDRESATVEIAQSRRVIGERLGVPVDHFAYPVGAPDAAGEREFRIAEEAGYRTAVTTRPGVIFPEHAEHLTALPRISVNGSFQQLRFVEVLLSGAPTAILNGFRRVDAA
jgi:peptidoglycan/xylan/chitin deacetylase (PgdA/CDA1 family)